MGSPGILGFAVACEFVRSNLVSSRLLEFDGEFQMLRGFSEDYSESPEKMGVRTNAMLADRFLDARFSIDVRAFTDDASL